MLEENLAVVVYFLFLVFYSCIIDVGLHAVRCIMHPSRGLCMCIIYAVQDDVHPVLLDLTASS